MSERPHISRRMKDGTERAPVPSSNRESVSLDQDVSMADATFDLEAEEQSPKPKRMESAVNVPRLDSVARALSREHERGWNEVEEEISLLRTRGMTDESIADFYKYEYLRLSEKRESIIDTVENGEERARVEALLKHARGGLLIFEKTHEMDLFLVEQARERAHALSKKERGPEEKQPIEELPETSFESAEEPEVKPTPPDTYVDEQAPQSSPTLLERIVLNPVRKLLGRTPPPESPVA